MTVFAIFLNLAFTEKNGCKDGPPVQQLPELRLTTLLATEWNIPGPPEICTIVQACYFLYRGCHQPEKPLKAKEVIMLLSQAVTNFMEYQKMNSGKKYDQELQAFPG